MVSELARVVHLRELAQYTRWTILVFAPIFVLIVLLEKRSGADERRYLSRNFFNDILYAFFYQVPYTVFILLPIMAVFKPHIGVFLPGLPLPVSLTAFLLIVDFGFYWIHRLQHAVPLLWAFHSVHHTQQRLTFLTSYRLHLLDQLLGVANLMGISLLLGAPAGSFLPIVLAYHLFESAQHAELDWRYGKLYRLIVSPMFHAVHHSTDAQHYNKNFGKILSVWDFVFGTAEVAQCRPSAYGVAKLPMRESILHQFIAPFRLLQGRATLAEASSPEKPS